MIDPRDLDDLVAIKRAGSLSAAAKRRGVAVSTISRRIGLLESAMKLPLVDRRANGTRLTRQGEEIARLAESLVDQLERITSAADALRADGSRRPVRITATEFVVAEVLSPALPRLWAMGCDFPVHLQSQGEIVSLAGREADVAIRMSRPEGASLIIRKLAEIRLAHYASRAYLADRDPTAIDFRREKLIVYDDSYGRMPELDWISQAGLADAIAMRTGSTRALLQAVLSGAGIAQLPKAFASRKADLVELPVLVQTPPRIPWLIVHRDLRHYPSIRIVKRWIIEAFAKLRTA